MYSSKTNLKINLRPVTHIIFDLDGTLINTMDSIENSFRDLIRSYGKEPSPEFPKSMYNFTQQRIAEYLIEFLGINNEIDKNLLLNKIKSCVSNKTFDLMPGVDKLVRHLHKHRIPMSIATANSSKPMKEGLSRFGNFFAVGNYFSHIVGCDDPEVVTTKPSPDTYFVCLKRFKKQPKGLDNVLVIEDTLDNIKTAIEIGMRTLLVKDKRIRDEDVLRVEGINAVINSLNDFKPENFGLPSYQS